MAAGEEGDTERRPLVTPVQTPGRFQQLDALRAVAIGIVMLHHFINPPIVISGFGVTFLFVLSGYFAVNTLLKLRRKVDDGREEIGGATREFYLRRYLRICPPYFLVLFITALCNVDGARDGLPWNAFFLANFQTMIHESWNGRFAPLWSLSFLEQFYLFCPIVVLCCPRRRLVPVLIAIAAAGPLWRLVCAWQNFSPIEWCVCPLSSLDAVGCGALLALGRETMGRSLLLPRLLAVCRWVGIPGFLFLMTAKALHRPPPFTEVLVPAAASLFFVWVAEKSSRGFHGAVGAVLNIPLLARIGQMSYSIFLLHTFTELVLPHTGVLGTILESNYRPLVLIPVTIGLAQFSWHGIEKPMTDLRRRKFSSSTAQAPEAPVAAALPVLGTS